MALTTLEIPVFGSDGKLRARGSPCSRPESGPDSGTCPRNPAFASDGTILVFTGLVGGKRNLYTVGIDGSALTQITRAGGKSPAWSSGGQIAYHAVGQVWRLRPGTGRTRVAEGRYPDWSASGRSIAYEFKRNTYRVPARKGAARKLVSEHAERPVFSPDSGCLVVEDTRGARRIEVRKDDAEGSNRVLDAGQGIECDSLALSAGRAFSAALR